MRPCRYKCIFLAFLSVMTSAAADSSLTDFPANAGEGDDAARLLKQVEKPDGGLRKVPRFVTNGFERADGTFVVALFAAPGPTANAATSAATEPISFDSSAYAEDVGGPISFSSMPTGLFIIFS